MTFDFTPYDVALSWMIMDDHEVLNYNCWTVDFIFARVSYLEAARQYIKASRAPGGQS